ncbi:MAG: transcription antitermination factor NusB [Lachnospiraceae bacterium]|nr:transcription antitermination factor NusB [Lachnospiraceae bacterium]
MSRKKLRLLSMKALFEYEFYPQKELKEQVEQFLLQEETLEETDRAMLSERVLDAASKIPDLDREINEVTEGWTTSRMNKVDLTLIRLALYEMRFDPETPTKVAIDEAVELAHQFGGEESPKFVNGVLARFVKENT